MLFGWIQLANDGIEGVLGSLAVDLDDWREYFGDPNESEVPPGSIKSIPVVILLNELGVDNLRKPSPRYFSMTDMAWEALIEIQDRIRPPETDEDFSWYPCTGDIWMKGGDVRIITSADDRRGVLIWAHDIVEKGYECGYRKWIYWTVGASLVHRGHLNRAMYQKIFGEESLKPKNLVIDPI